MSGDLNADNYTVDGYKITKKIAEKDFKIVLNNTGQAGTLKAGVPENDKHRLVLDDNQIKRVAEILDLCKRNLANHIGT